MPLATRSQRRIESLRDILNNKNSDKLVLFITGAGISEESGVPLYRADTKHKDEKKIVIWNSFVEEWCTIDKFKSDPTNWYKTFWEKTHMTQDIINAKPNFSHESIARLCCSAPSKFKVITQNVDCLHRCAGTPDDCIIEGHGSHDFYRCLNNKSNCIKSYKEPIRSNEIKYLNNYDTIQRPFPALLTTKNLPSCPVCSSVCMPMILTFGETYNSHSFFQWMKAKQWTLLADVIIFVGTSFSVTLTDFALLCSFIKDNKLTYSINKFPKATIEFNYTDRQFENVSKMWKLISLYKQQFSSIKLLSLIETHKLITDTCSDPSNPNTKQLEELSATLQHQVSGLPNILDSEFSYLCNPENWLNMDESEEDHIINTAHYKNMCTMVNSASTQFQQLGF